MIQRRAFTRASALRSLLVLFSFVVFANATEAQHPGGANSAAPPPAGDGVLTVQIIQRANTPDDASGVAGIDIALYALSKDGTPGFAGGATDADGRFVFEGISNDPGIVYLVGARYHEIPFGQRVTFETGSTEALVEIEVSEPTEDTAGVVIEELRVRVDWMGDRIVVREIIRLSNPGNQPIQLPAEDRSRSIVVRPLGPTAADFASGPRGIDDGIEFTDGKIRFWGPLYPGDQRVEYQYSLPSASTASDGGSIRIPIQLASSARRVVVVAGTSGLEFDGASLIESSDVQADSGQTLKAWARAGLAANEVFEINVALPESRRDSSLVTIPRGDVWLELDDTRLTARVDIQVEVEPGAPVAGSADAPLLRVTLPEGAIMQGVAPEAEAFGLIPTENGGFDIVGPIGPGSNSIGYSYYMPAGRDGIDLRMLFPGEVETLNVLIADTGLALDSSRLHRLRPFRNGTRNYLHREAFNISPNEVVDLELVPLRANGIPRAGAIGMTLAAAAAGAFFLFTPLRTEIRRKGPVETVISQIQVQRESVYTAIRDLDHDYDTKKLDEADYQQMRSRLRAEAIELLRAEHAGAVDGSPAQAVQASLGDAAPAAQTGAFCPECGGKVLDSWKFCSHCGGTLNPLQEASV